MTSLLWGSLIFLSSLVVALTVVCFRVWSDMRLAHRRLHRLEQDEVQREQQNAIVCRSACSALASAIIPGQTMATCHSQHGEELFLWDLLDRKRNGFFIEIGAYNGRSLSNSFFFEQIGWHGILVEADPELAQQCRQNRPDSQVVHAALGERDGGSIEFSIVRGGGGLDTLNFVDADDAHRRRIESRGGRVERIQVPSRSLAAVLDELQPPSIDWMTIDVEGVELQVLKGSALDRFQPRIVVIEDNSGGRDPAIRNYLAEHAYHYHMRLGCNDFYVRKPAD